MRSERSSDCSLPDIIVLYVCNFFFNTHFQRLLTFRGLQCSKLSSVVDMHLNPEKIGRETSLVSKEAHFFCR